MAQLIVKADWRRSSSRFRRTDIQRQCVNAPHQIVTECGMNGTVAGNSRERCHRFGAQDYPKMTLSTLLIARMATVLF